MLVGYARVSTSEQHLDLQLDALSGAGCDKIFSDKTTGVRMSRPGLDAALGTVGAGDVLVVWKIDRLGRSVKGLVQLIEDLHGRGAHFRSLTDAIDTRGAQGKFFFHVMAAFAEMEREILRERTKAGLAAAAVRGRKGGRPLAMTPAKREAAQRLIAQGIPFRDISVAIGVSVPTLYRWFPGSQSGVRDASQAIIRRRPVTGK